MARDTIKNRLKSAFGAKRGLALAKLVPDVTVRPQLSGYSIRTRDDVTNGGGIAGWLPTWNAVLVSDGCRLAALNFDGSAIGEVPGPREDDHADYSLPETKTLCSTCQGERPYSVVAPVKRWIEAFKALVAAHGRAASLHDAEQALAVADAELALANAVRNRALARLDETRHGGASVEIKNKLDAADAAFDKAKGKLTAAKEAAGKPFNRGAVIRNGYDALGIAIVFDSEVQIFPTDGPQLGDVVVGINPQYALDAVELLVAFGVRPDDDITFTFGDASTPTVFSDGVVGVVVVMPMRL